MPGGERRETQKIDEISVLSPQDKPTTFMRVKPSFSETAADASVVETNLILPHCRAAAECHIESEFSAKD